MHTNVQVYFRVMRRLCRREWNWLWNWRCVNQHSWDPWQRTRDHGVWRLTLTAYCCELNVVILLYFSRHNVTCKSMHAWNPTVSAFKVAATSLKLEIRLYAHRVGTNTRSGTEAKVQRSSHWLVCSEPDYSARSLISGLDDGATTLILAQFSTTISKIWH